MASGDTKIIDDNDGPNVEDPEVMDADDVDDNDGEEEEDEGDDDEDEEDEGDHDNDDNDDSDKRGSTTVGKSIGKGFGKMIAGGIGKKTCNVAVNRPPRKISAAMREKRFNAKVKKLSSADINNIIQYAPFQRMIVNALSDGVERVSTVAVHALMDAAVNYAHEIYNDSYTITKVSNQKQTLMLRHVAGAMYAKGTVARP